MFIEINIKLSHWDMVHGSMVHRSGYEVMEIVMMGIRRDVILLLSLVFVFCSGVSERVWEQPRCCDQPCS